jgi:hypothetical protein
MLLKQRVLRRLAHPAAVVMGISRFLGLCPDVSIISLLSFHMIFIDTFASYI